MTDNKIEEQIDKLIRDICRAGFMPKSQARARINEIIQQAKQEERAELLKTFPKPNGTLNNNNWEKYVEKIDAWKYNLIPNPTNDD